MANDHKESDQNGRSDYPFWILIGVAVIIIIVLLVTKGNNGDNDDLADASPTPTSGSPSGSTASPAPGNPVRSNNPSLTADIYNQAVVVFSGRRLAFDANCNITSDTMTFRSMTQVMLDNRTNTRSLQVKIGDQNYTLLGNGWFQTTLWTNNTLPAELPVLCDGNTVGRITLTQ